MGTLPSKSCSNSPGPASSVPMCSKRPEDRRGVCALGDVFVLVLSAIVV